MTKIKSLQFLFVVLFVTSIGANAQSNNKYKWNLTDLYASTESWSMEKDRLIADFKKISPYKGKITQSADHLLSFLDYTYNIKKRQYRLYNYAMMNFDTDTRNMKFSGMVKEVEQAFAKYDEMSAFVIPEILLTDWNTIEKYIKNNPKLEVYKKPLSDLFLKKEHTLSEKEERIMALSGLITDNGQSIYNTFKNAEMPNASIKLSDGETVILNSAGYSKYRSTSNRSDREMIFDAFWNNYSNYEGSFGEMLYANVKSMIFLARARNYESTLEARLSPSKIPVDIYHSLIENVNNNLETFHRYLNLKKRMLEVDTLKYSDLYAPAVKNIDLQYTFDQAQELIIKSLYPLGEDYVSIVKQAFKNRWIDVYPTPGKRSGAYSSGMAYDVHPYILLNYNEQYEDVSTLAHELGHTMQSYMSNKAQPFPISRYPSFVAEVASTFNEVLLFDEMMKTEKNNNIRLSLLMNRLESFRTTLFRQTQFAEFELTIHQAAEKGQPLTGEFLSNTYQSIINSYYGHDKSVCLIDDNIKLEWAYIPHFYYNFYVYQYSTSFTASNSLAQKVINNTPGALEKYLFFLSTGDSEDAIIQLKKAGVDMTTSQPFNDVIKDMNYIMDQIEEILNKRK